MRKPKPVPRPFTRYVGLVTLVFAVAIGTAVASLFFANPAKDASFRADVTLHNLPSSVDSGSLPGTEQFAAVATSPVAMKRTSDSLAKEGLNIGAAELPDRLVVAARLDGKTLDFAVKYGDGDTALAVARAWSDVALKLMPEQAPALELQAAAPQRDQLERAGEELQKRRAAVSELEGPALVGQAAGGRIGVIATEYQTTLVAIARKGVERTSLQAALDRLHTAFGEGTALSRSQLRVILAGVLPADVTLDGSLSPEEAAAALEIRLKAVDSAVAGMQQEAQFLRRALDKTTSDLQQATVDMEAAEDSYRAAEAAVHSLQVAASSIQAEASLVQSPHLDRGGAFEWGIRLGAAAAIAFVVSVLGVLMLRRSRGRTSERVRAVQTYAAGPNVPPVTGNVWRAREAAACESGQKKMRHRTEAVVAAVIAVLLAGLLGTFAVRQRSRRRVELRRR